MSAIGTSLVQMGVIPAFALLEIRRCSTQSYGAALAGTASGLIPPGGSRLLGDVEQLVAAYMLPIPPTDTQADMEPSIEVTRTGGGAVREHSGDRIRKISFSGEVGLAVRLGMDASGQLRYLPSRDLFEELWKFLARYLRLQAHDPSEPQPPNSTYDLVLRYFDRNWHYIVEPVRPFTAAQDQQHRQTFRYDLNFETICEARGALAQSPLASVIATGQKVLDVANRVTEKAGLVIALSGAATKALAGAADKIKQPLVTLQSAVNVLQVAAGNLDSILRLPADYATGIAALGDGLAATFHAEVAAMPVAKRRAASADAATWVIALDDMRDAAAQLAVPLGQQPTISGGVAASSAFPYQTHELQSGEDLPAVARLRLGDETRWTEIADINRLSPPYVSSAGLPGTVRSGAIILLPSDAGPGVADGSSSGAGSPGSEETLYGVDVWLQDGDLVPVSIGGADLDDFAFRRGIPNVTDALARRLATPLGSNAVFPRLGISPLVGEPSTKIGAWLLASMVEQLQRDDRVQEVQSPSLLDGGDSATIDLTPLLVGGRKVTVAASSGA